MDQDFTLFSFVLAHPRFRRDGRKAVENRRRKNCTERLDETLARVECGMFHFNEMWKKRALSHRAAKDDK